MNSRKDKIVHFSQPIRYTGKNILHMERTQKTKKKWRNRKVLRITEIKDLNDLLCVAWNYQGDRFDWFKLWNMIPPLTELNNMVGMTKLKDEIIDLVIYHIQGLHLAKSSSEDSKTSTDMFHTVLYGKPGVGKTMVAGILAKIYCRMGLLSTEKVIMADRKNFIGKYIGHSEDKTTKLLESALGGVLFIDEAYGLGHGTNTDSFSKGSVDILNKFLSDHAGEFICIIAGYEKDLDECFFSINQGLKDRFSRRYHLEDYSPNEIEKIFRNKVYSEGWKLNSDSIPPDFFTNNIDSFPSFGRDVNTFLGFCKTAHSRQTFLMDNPKIKTLTRQNIESGYEKFSQVKKRKQELTPEVRFMYS